MIFTKARISVLILSLILVIVLAGCGGGNGDSQSQSKSANQGAQQSASNQTASLEKGDPETGQPLYIQSCSACHGPDGTGIKGLGKDLTTSQFAKNLSDKEFLEYVKQGRSVDDPLNTTGVAMPPKGGNPALTDQQIMHIIAYIRTLEK